MIETAIRWIGPENLENLAVSWHRPLAGNYILVSQDRYKVINEKRMWFNSKYQCMDFYSGLVTMNKPISSKLITSNNYFAFWVKDTEKLTNTDIDDYYNTLNLPSEYDWFRTWIKGHIWEFGKEYNGRIKIFFTAPAEEYRRLGMKNWYEKSISFSKLSKDLGTPLGFSINSKKPYQTTKRTAYLVDYDKGLRIKLFYDILKGMSCNGYNLLYVKDDGTMYPAKAGKGVDTVVVGGILFAFSIDKKGQVRIADMDTVVRHSPLL